jgi:hypothetical protein
VAEPLAALLVELPQREIGGLLPAWDDLVAQVGWARDRDTAVHLDGARLWEAAAGYERSPAEVAALFDSVYVSFYKGIGALAETERVWTWPSATPTVDPSVVRVELSVGRGTCAMTPTEVADAVARLVQG